MPESELIEVLKFPVFHCRPLLSAVSVLYFRHRICDARDISAQIVTGNLCFLPKHFMPNGLIGGMKLAGAIGAGNVNKPTVFLSHSSKDGKCLSRLRGLLLEKTGSAIRVFLSSDGQSIPFGRNWNNEIEQALNTAKITFVFLTSNSVRSNWVHFECGFCYCKGVKVIPIGFLGVDLNSVSGPLNLLQGFNINSEVGLNNLISIINQEFGLTFGSSFTQTDFQGLISLSETYKVEDASLETVEFIEFSFESPTSETDVLHAIVQACLDEQRIQYANPGNQSSFFTFGMNIYQQFRGGGKRYTVVRVAPTLLEKNIQCIIALQKRMCPAQEMIEAALFIHNDFKLMTSFYQISSRLAGCDVQLSDGDGRFDYGGLTFKACENKAQDYYIIVTLPTKDLERLSVGPLLALLSSRGIISPN